MPMQRDGVAGVDGLLDSALAFRFSSGRLCLDFCATVGERWRQPLERLQLPVDLGRWLVEAGLTEHQVPVSQDLLRNARRLREAIYRLVEAARSQRPGEESDRAVVNDFARRPTLVPQIGPDQRRQLWPGRDAGRASLATVAADAVDLLTSGAITRVRACEAPDCALLFLDSSRPGRRRWCADTACGSRNRTAGYRRRRASAARG